MERRKQDLVGGVFGGIMFEVLMKTPPFQPVTWQGYLGIDSGDQTPIHLLWRSESEDAKPNPVSAVEDTRP